MAKANHEGIPRRHYDEAARAKLKAHIMQVAARRRKNVRADDVTWKPFWDRLWHQLEAAAAGFDWGEELRYQAIRPRDTIDQLTKRIELIDDLCHELRKPTNWDFTSDTKNPWRRLVKSEPSRFGDLIGALETARKQTEIDVAGLRRELAGEPKMRARIDVDCEGELKGRLLDIGRSLFGQQIGNPEGPLVTFLHLALTPVLGEATPDKNALRTWALRAT